MKHPVAVPILFVRTVARSQKRPEMFGSFPNSTGSFGDLVTQEGYTSLGTAQGSFYTRPGGYGDLIRVVNGSFDYISPPSGYDGIGFDLSRNSSIFSGNKLQSSALQVLPCIRT